MTKATKTLNPLHFEDLDPHRFEDLVRQIIYDFKAWRSLEPTGRLGSDDGYDARGHEIVDEQTESETEDTDDRDDDPQIPASPDRLWQIQCKREKSITPVKIRKYVDEMLNAPSTPPYGIIFAAPCDFSKKTRDNFAQKIREKGVQEFHLWGKADLEDMLLQPKNDHLLYAYFGISLTIRRRSLKTQIRSILATKRKSVKHLGPTDRNSYVEVLLRDAEDTHYPFKGEVKDFKTNPRWEKVYFVGHYHHGIRILKAKYYAYREMDDQTRELLSWDFSNEVNLAKPHNDPWNVEPESESESFQRGYAFWDRIGKANQAYFEIEGLIPYERIIEIDPLGDGIVNCPQLFIQKRDGRFLEYDECYLKGPDNWSPSQHLLKKHKEIRKKFFPDKFPEVKREETLAPSKDSNGKTEKEK
jgi:hypothetical protein